MQSQDDSAILTRLDDLRANTNFYSKQIYIRDQLVLNVFVNHDKLDLQGKPISDGQAVENSASTGSSNPGHSVSSSVQPAAVELATESAARDVDSSDATDPESDDELDLGNLQADEESKQDAQSEFASTGQKADENSKLDEEDDADEAQSAKEVINQYRVEVIAQHKDFDDELLLHWAVGKQSAGEWVRPEDSWLPPSSNRWPDNIAVQSPFVRNRLYPEYRTLQMAFKWIEETEKPIQAINFVILEKNKNWWHNNGGQNYQIPCALAVAKPSQAMPVGDDNPTEGLDQELLPLGKKLGEFFSEIIQCEVVYSSWTLMHRYFRCRDMLRDRVDLRDVNFPSVLLVWLRYSFIRQLTWQKRYNTKPRELQHSQVCLTEEIAAQFKNALKLPDSEQVLGSADLLRQLMGLVGKGSGNGQRVRDEILHIMHRHHISERSGHFYEQWHQKLHNNTTPDDIPICEALLSYLKSGGNMGQYWEVLGKNGIDRNRLATYERKITEEPYYLPNTIHDFEEYLKLLKQLHSSNDLQMLVDEARGHIGGDGNQAINDVLSNFSDHDTLRQMERVTRIREILSRDHLNEHQSNHKVKDVLFLDLCLEGYIKTLSDRIMHIDIGFEAYVREVGILLANLALSYRWQEIKACLADWRDLASGLCHSGNINNEDNARKVKAIMDRIRCLMGEVNDTYTEQIQTKAELLGTRFGVQDYSRKLFAEELLRSSLFFSLSMIMKKTEPQVRQKANLGDWLVISQGRSYGSRGYATRVKNLADVMLHTYERRTCLIVDKITGEEEVPSNVQAIVLLASETGDHPDVLSHVSVRARNLKVLLCVLFDQQKSEQLAALEGKHIFLQSLTADDVRFELQSPHQALTRKASSHLILQTAIQNAAQIQEPPALANAVMSLNEFNPKQMGAKSNNLKVLKEQLPDWMHVPESICLPFKVMEHCLRVCDPQGSARVERLVRRLTKTKKVDKMAGRLLRCKQIVLNLQYQRANAHDPVIQELQQRLQQFGCTDFAKAWTAIKKVWASKFNERAFLAMKKLGASLNQVFMAVLIQKIVKAQYAYVIHTTNPTNGIESEIYVEACRGLGESLVSDAPGAALRFTVTKNTAIEQARSQGQLAGGFERCRVNAYANKPIELVTDCGFIFRSDSNSEDLPGFAGAGLFDSYAIEDERKQRVTYSKDRLMTDGQFKAQFMSTVGTIGEVIEGVYEGEPQDIEGALSVDGKYYVVQTRPQV